VSALDAEAGGATERRRRAGGAVNGVTAHAVADRHYLGEREMADEADRRSVESRFMTLKEVATYLSVREPQVYALVPSGDFPAIKIGGQDVWRVDRTSSTNTSSV
jgi:excisionase family DNA binding protein